MHELVKSPVIPLLLNRLEDRIYNYVWSVWRKMGVVIDNSTVKKQKKPQNARKQEAERYNVERVVFILDG